MRVIWLICFILWSVLVFNLGELKQKRIAHEQFVLITDDAVKRIEHLKMEKQSVIQVCRMQEEMCVEELGVYEKDLVDLYIMLVVREKALKYIFEEYHCFKKEEI